GGWGRWRGGGGRWAGAGGGRGTAATVTGSSAMARARRGVEEREDRRLARAELLDLLRRHGGGGSDEQRLAVARERHAAGAQALDEGDRVVRHSLSSSWGPDGGGAGAATVPSAAPRSGGSGGSGGLEGPSEVRART